MSKLMKPLFVNGMYNKEGKRIRANYLKTITDNNTEYILWINDGKPDKDYASNEKDKYYLYILVNDWLVMIGETEFELERRAAYEYLNKEWYGDFQGREKYFHENFYNGQTYEEYNSLVKEHVAKEEVFIQDNINNESIQVEFINQFVERSIKGYVDARDGKSKYVDFRGAVFLDELDKCAELSLVLKKERQEEDQERRKILAEQKAQERKEKEQAEKLLMEETEQILINGGTIKGGEIVVKLADKYNINIPIRTRGWILHNLAEATITDVGSISYRYFRRSKNATGSQKVYDVLFGIKKAIKTA